MSPYGQQEVTPFSGGLVVDMRLATVPVVLAVLIVPAVLAVFIALTVLTVLTVAHSCSQCSLCPWFPPHLLHPLLSSTHLAQPNPHLTLGEILPLPNVVKLYNP